MPRSRLYSLVIAACLAGFGWLAFLHSSLSGNGLSDVCIIKSITGIPCPACGTSRSVLSIFEGDLYGAFIWNPFGYIIAGIMVLCPLWIIMDVVTGKESFFKIYKQAETILRKRLISVPLAGIVLANWIWNIWKGI